MPANTSASPPRVVWMTSDSPNTKTAARPHSYVLPSVRFCLWRLASHVQDIADCWTGPAQCSAKCHTSTSTVRKPLDASIPCTETCIHSLQIFSDRIARRDVPQSTAWLHQLGSPEVALAKCLLTGSISTHVGDAADIIDPWPSGNAAACCPGCPCPVVTTHCTPLCLLHL